VSHRFEIFEEQGLETGKLLITDAYRLLVADTLSLPYRIPLLFQERGC
jgi:hypothetical protein